MDTNQFYIDHTVFAGSGKRLANLIIDFIVSYLIVFFITLVTTFVAGLLELHDLLIWLMNISSFHSLLITMILRLSYYIIMEAAFQRTVGKMITGTRVVQIDGSKPDLGTIGVRTLCRLIPFEQFSFLGSEARGWHDSLSKTYVVDVKKYEQELYLKMSFEELGKQEEVA